MSWTAPRTWVVGEIFTAALANTHIRDNLLETAAAKVTTKGDLPAATGANALARLGVGANDTVLMAASGEATGLKWGTVSGMKKITGTGYQWYVNSGSNAPYGVTLAGTSSVDTFVAYSQLKASTDQIDEITHIMVALTGNQFAADRQGLLQIATGGAGSETVKSAMVWHPNHISTYADGNGIITTLPVPIEVAASTRIAVRAKYSGTGGATIYSTINLGYVAKSDLGDLT